MGLMLLAGQDWTSNHQTKSRLNGRQDQILI